MTCQPRSSGCMVLVMARSAARRHAANVRLQGLAQAGGARARGGRGRVVEGARPPAVEGALGEPFGGRRQRHAILCQPVPVI